MLSGCHSPATLPVVLSLLLDIKNMRRGIRQGSPHDGSPTTSAATFVKEDHLCGRR